MAATFEKTEFGQRYVKREDELLKMLNTLRGLVVVSTGDEKESFQRLADQIVEHLKAFGTSY